MKTILILDANSLLNRAFYGIRPLSTREGLPTNAVFGYLNIVKKHLDAIKPDFAVAAFDMHAPTFRHKFDADYKATRKPMPDDLKKQMPYLRRATEALGLAIVEKEGYEADDILGTLSRLAEDSGISAVLVTGDRDSYQLVSDKTTLILAGTNKDERITPAVIFEKFHLLPRQMIDVKALAGDTSDNIPGVRGIGEKTALKLIQENQSLDGVYEHPETLAVGPSAKEKIIAGKESAYKSRYLAEICRNVPDIGAVDAFPYRGIDEEKMRTLLCELEFSRLLRVFHLDEAKETSAKEESAPLQGTIFDAPPPAEVSIEDKDAITCHGDGAMLTFDKNDFYLLEKGVPYRLVGDVETFLRGASPVVCDYKAYLHFFYLKFGDITGVKAAFDLLLASYVVHSQENAGSLSRLALIYLKEATPPGAEDQVAYRLCLMDRLFPVLQKALEEDGCLALYRDIELPLAYVLAKMELCGFQVSRAGLEAYGATLQEEMQKVEEKIYEFAGEKFLIHSPKQLGRILFEKLHLPPGKKTKTGYATDAETLGKLRAISPIVDLVLQYRALSKLYSTYVLGMLSQIDENGRIHTIFHQRQTATGRLSSAEPNLQNIPVRTALGREMRKFFTAKDPSFTLIDADYSQIELRIVAHISGDETLRRYFCEGKDIHTQTAAEIFHVPQSEVTSEMRKSAKAVNFGIIYGIGEYSLSQDLGIPMRFAKEYIEQYFALFPNVKSYMDNIKKEAHEKGYVQTLFGRRRYIPELKGPKKNLIAFGERVAMNAPIQGTAADIIKLAMVRVDQRLEKEHLKARLVLQVHDELILEAPKEEAEYAARLLSEEMENAVSLSVPLVAEAHSGFTWYDAK